MSDIKYTVTEVHISEIRPGDTVEHNGSLKTVCRSNIKKGFMGRTLFGDCYKLGTQLVKRAEIFHARAEISKVPAGGASKQPARQNVLAWFD